MNRMDRLFAITLLLQAKKRLRAQDLAQKFEVDERTIYRDMAALSESGVPIVGTPGEGYALIEGYYLPPLLFTQNEAAALFLGAHMLMANATGHVPQDARAALDKISVALPKHLRAEMDRMREIIHFAGTMRPFNLEEPHLMQLQQAIQERRVVSIRYQSFRGGSGESEVTEREIEPYGLGFAWGAWYVYAYCCLRQAMRGFRLERIDALTLTNKTFELRQSQPVVRPMRIVRIRFAPQVVRWVRERQHYGYRGDESNNARGVVMRFEIEALDELKAWLLGWGADAEPLEPPELREMIRAEVAKMEKVLLT
jgi:predicted DNA-binding transcriptional regulator YafY